jgi:hypothetical protein
MVKGKYPYFHFICFGLVALSLLLPYIQYDLQGGGFWGGGPITKRNIQESGLEHPESYITLAFIAFASFIALIKRHLATAIISLIISVGGLLYMPILAFALTFTLFGPKTNMRVQWGFLIAALTMLTYVSLMIANLVYVNRERKQGYKSSLENNDIIDDADLLETL